MAPYFSDIFLTAEERSIAVTWKMFNALISISYSF